MDTTSNDVKILVGNNKLKRLGGSETYAYTMVAELVRQGHKVECVASGKLGVVSSMIGKLGVPVHLRPISGSYDLALLSHSTSIALTKDVRAFKVQTCHGIFPALEQPVMGMNAHVAISEEVMTHLVNKGFLCTLIHNGVDCERFKPDRPIRNTLKKVLSLGHSSIAHEVIEKACAAIDCKLIVNDKYKNPVWDVQDVINQADLVVGLGRGIYEAAACGRNAVIFDHRPYMGKGIKPMGDGYVTELNFPLFLLNNCSGRYSHKSMDWSNLVDEFKKYQSHTGQRLREYVLENLNIEKQVKKYLALVR